MSDDELIEHVRIMGGYLLVHNRLHDMDVISRLCARLAQTKEELAAAQAEIERLRDLVFHSTGRSTRRQKWSRN